MCHNSSTAGTTKLPCAHVIGTGWSGLASCPAQDASRVFPVGSRAARHVVRVLTPPLLAMLLRRSKWMQQQMEIAAHWGVYTYNKEIRDLVAVGAACGVTTAFKAPVRNASMLSQLSTHRQHDSWGCGWIPPCYLIQCMLRDVWWGWSKCRMVRGGQLGTSRRATVAHVGVCRLRAIPTRILLITVTGLRPPRGAGRAGKTACGHVVRVQQQ